MPLEAETPQYSEIPIQQLDVSAYRVPTDTPESDGTLSWDATTLVLVQIHAGGCMGIGFSYADAATAHLVNDTLKPLVVGSEAMNIAGIGRPV